MVGPSKYCSWAHCGKYVLFVFGDHRSLGCQKWQYLFSTSMDGDGGIGCWQLPEAEKRVRSHSGLLKMQMDSKRLVGIGKRKFMFRYLMLRCTECGMLRS